MRTTKRTASDEHLGPTLRRLREARGLKLSDAAAAAGTDKGSISRIERSHRDPSLAQLRALAGLYGVRPSVLMTDSLPRPSSSRKPRTRAA